MDHDQQIRELFDKAVELTGEARESFLRELTVDQGMMGELVELIKAHETEPASLEKPLIDLRSMFDASSSNGDLEDNLDRTWIGRRIAAYEVVRRIGHGGMGIVFEARQEHPKRLVALKMLRRGLRSGEERRRFEHESRALGLLQHPCIAQVFEAGTAEIDDDHRPYFAMELVDGVPLTQFATDNHLSIQQRLTLFRKIGEAVHHAHLRGVIHRDLKPDNILVMSDGSPKVLDFGIARMTNADVQTTTMHTNIGNVIGTLSYMSPEQASGNPDEVDLRSDVYALGIILYELLAGRRPRDLKGTMIHEAVRIIREEEPARLGTVDKAFRGDLDAIVAKAMEKDPQRRYQSAIDLVVDIQHFLEHQPIVARAPSNIYRLGKFVRRHRIGVFAGSVVALALLVAAGISIVFAVSEASQRRIAEDATQLAQTNLALAERREQEASSARDELETVAKFQSSMLSNIDAETMGRNVLENLREHTIEGLVENRASQEHIDAVLASFDELNATDIALQIVDEEILARAVETIAKEFADQPLLEAALRLAIGDTYRKLGLYPQSLPQLERTLAIRRRELGDEDPETLESINDMGVLLQSLGKHAEALIYSREALNGNRRILGDEHPNTLSTMNSMGVLLQSTGNYAEALFYYRDALEGRRRVLGDDHPDTLQSNNNMGTVLESMGKYAEALPYLREALEARRRLLGNEHPQTLTSINDIGSLFYSMGKYAESLPYFREAMEASRRVLGDEHPDTLVSIGNLGFILRSMDKYTEAMPYYRETLDTMRRVLGADHPDTLTSINNMGVLLNKMGKPAEALPYHREALEGRRHVLGDDHPNTLFSIGNMGLVLIDLGRHKEAVALLEANEPVARKTWTGGNARSLGIYLQKLGKGRAGLGESGKAESTLLEAHELLASGYGKQHKRTLRCVKSLVELYTEWGKPDKAAEWRENLPSATPDE